MKISGQKLIQTREAAGVTRSDLAVAADLTHARIWQIETSDFAHVNSNVVKAMADLIGVVPEELQA